MPNWCTNELRLAADPEKLHAIVRLMEDGEDNSFIGGLIPCPMNPDNPEEYFDGWYAWQVVNWGCKWGDSHTSYNFVNGDLHIYFDTPWSPPIPVYEKLAGMGYQVCAYYVEFGMAFCGRWQDGKDLQYDELPNVPAGNTVGGYKDAVLEEIDAAMGISDALAEFTG